MAEFDPYLSWLDISADQRPVSNHRLLGVNPGETNISAIKASADRVRAVLQPHISGEHADHARSLLAAVEQAKAELLAAAKGFNSDSSTEPVMKSAPPVPGTGSANSDLASSSQHTAGPERQVRSAPPPPGSEATTGAANGFQIKSPPPLGGPPADPASAAASSNASSLPPPPSLPGVAVPPSPTTPGSAASPNHSPEPPPALGVSMTGGPTPGAPFPPAPPPTTPPPSSAAVVPVGQPAAPRQTMPPAEPQESAPSWAPQDRSGTVGKSVAETVAGQRSVSIRTRKAKSLRSKVRRESEAATYSIILGVTVIIIGLIVLLTLVAFS